MKAVLHLKEKHLGDSYLVIPKIREVSKGLGSVVITFDNGEKKILETSKIEDEMKNIVNSIEEYYKT